MLRYTKLAPKSRTGKITITAHGGDPHPNASRSRSPRAHDLMSRNRNLLEEVPSAAGFTPCTSATKQSYRTNFIPLKIARTAPRPTTSTSSASQWNRVKTGAAGAEGRNADFDRRTSPVFVATNEIEAALVADLRTYVVLPESASGVFQDPEATVVSSSVAPQRIEAEVLTQTNHCAGRRAGLLPGMEGICQRPPCGLLRANGAFQAVPAGPGKNIVLLLYQDENSTQALSSRPHQLVWQFPC